MWNYGDSSDHTLRNYLRCDIKLVKNTDIDKQSYSRYGIEFEIKGNFSFPTGEFDKNVIIFEAGMSFSVHVDNKKKDILILGEGPTQELLDDNTDCRKKVFI